MEQYSISISEFISRAVGEYESGGMNYYYFEVPQDFKRPSIYFPAPEIKSLPLTLNSYEMFFKWKIRFIDKNTQSALNIAYFVMEKLVQNKNYIPLLNIDGKKSGEFIRLKEPEIQALNDGECVLHLSWSGNFDYIEEKGERVNMFYSDIKKK